MKINKSFFSALKPTESTEKSKATWFKVYRFRILSLFLFVVFLMSTWLVLYQQPQYPEALHISLQEQLKTIIQTTLVQQQPLAHNLQFQKIWTEADRSRDRIKAFFHYSFDTAPATRLFVKGEASMIKNTEDKAQELWQVVDIKTNNKKIEFSEPIVLHSDPNRRLDKDSSKDTALEEVKAQDNITEDDESFDSR